MKKIPAGAEASNVLVGEVDFLEQRIIAFVRLADAVTLGQFNKFLRNASRSSASHVIGWRQTCGHGDAAEYLVPLRAIVF